MALDAQGNEVGKLFVGGLHQSTNTDGLHNYFSQFGDIEESIVMMDNRTGRSRGFGYVKFKEPSTVDHVLSEKVHVIDNKEVDPKRCNINMRGKNRRSLKIFVGGIAFDHNEETIRTFFQSFGTVTDVNLLSNPGRPRHRGFAFVGFDDEEVVKKLINTRYVNLNGKQVEIKPMEPPNLQKSAGYMPSGMLNIHNGGRPPRGGGGRMNPLHPHNMPYGGWNPWGGAGNGSDETFGSSGAEIGWNPHHHHAMHQPWNSPPPPHQQHQQVSQPHSWQGSIGNGGGGMGNPQMNGGGDGDWDMAAAAVAFQNLNGFSAPQWGATGSLVSQQQQTVPNRSSGASGMLGGGGSNSGFGDAPVGPHADPHHQHHAAAALMDYGAAWGVGQPGSSIEQFQQPQSFGGGVGVVSRTSGAAANGPASTGGWPQNPDQWGSAVNPQGPSSQGLWGGAADQNGGALGLYGGPSAAFKIEEGLYGAAVAPSLHGATPSSATTGGGGRGSILPSSSPPALTPLGAIGSRPSRRHLLLPLTAMNTSVQPTPQC